MTINKDLKADALTISVGGRLDTSSSPELQKVLDESLSGIKSLVFDFSDLEYISSAGLRVLLSTQKKMNAADGKMVVKNVSETINEIFEITGFNDILVIE